MSNSQKTTTSEGNYYPFGKRCPRGRDSAYERGGMLVVSLRGVNFGFWSHVGCYGQNAIIFSREGLV